MALMAMQRRPFVELAHQRQGHILYAWMRRNRPLWLEEMERAWYLSNGPFVRLMRNHPYRALGTFRKLSFIHFLGEAYSIDDFI